MTIDPQLLLVLGIQLVVVGVILFVVGPAIGRRVPGASGAVLFGRTAGLVAGIVMISISVTGGATPMSGVPNPQPGTVTSVTTGAGLYQANCAQCHGVSAQGGGPLAGTTAVPPPSLVDHVAGHSDGDLYYWIANGLPGGMPAWSDKLSASDTWDLVNYLRTIQRK